MKKFTDGEWVIDEDPLNYGLIVKCNGHMVARAHSGVGIPYTEKAQYNAKLIKAAPRMYEMLESVLSEMDAIIDEVNCCRASVINSQTENEPDYIDKESLHDIQVLLAEARGEK